MSVDYAAGLSDYDDWGVCGIAEIVDTQANIEEKVTILANWIQQYKGSCIFHVGAGISTSAGIPDFRGPSGVWTKALKAKENKVSSKQRPVEELKMLPKHEDKTVKIEEISDLDNDIDPKNSVTFASAKPTFTHLAIKQLIDNGYADHVVSQNVDGLFLKTNMNRMKISELHGDFFLNECTRCRTRYIRSNPSETMGLKKSLRKCFREVCSGILRDTILDWESPIPHNELRTAKSKSKKCRLHVCIGTTMQLLPANQLPLEAIKKKPSRGRLVIINLQPTKLDKKADLVINGFADSVMERLCQLLSVDIPNYDETSDPTRRNDTCNIAWK